MRSISGFILLIACAGCTGGGQSAPPPAATGTPVTLTYPSGRIMASGEVLPGTTTRTGAWQEYFDADGSPRQWQREYEAGTWAESRPWREWNVDGSIRNDADD